GVTAGTPTKLIITSGRVQTPPNNQPTFIAGQPLNDIVVVLQDDIGNVVRTNPDRVVVSLAILQTGDHPTATLLRDGGQNVLYAQRDVVNGVATFSGVQAVVAGTKYQFNVSSDSIPVIDQSSPGPGFDVVAATAAALKLSSQPQDTASGTSIVGTPHPAVEAQLTDAFGNPIVSDNGTDV